jgi:vancomycin resistance protein VanJ
MTRFLAIASAAFAVLGLLIRLTVRDGWSGTALLYYALQLPVIGVLLLFAAAGCLRSGRRRCAGAALALCISTLVSWVALGSVRHSCDGRKGDFRALTWNLAYGRAGWDPIAGAIRRERADIIGLVEAQVRGPNPVRFWRPRFPEYDVRAVGRGLVLIVRGEVLSLRREEFGLRSRLAVAEVKIGGHPLRVVLVDLEANWLSPRGPLIERVRKSAMTPDGQPTLILGDFNTPGDSVWFQSLRRDHVDAFEQAGEGMRGTWPFFLPLMALDHLWISKGLEAVCAGKRASWLSDHSRVHAEISFSNVLGPSSRPIAARGGDSDTSCVSAMRSRMMRPRTCPVPARAF